MLDFIRIACAVPAVKVGDVEGNTRDICEYIKKADAAKADIVVFPELSMTGYTCQDLFFQDSIWQGVKKGLREIVSCSANYPEMTVLVGLPVYLGVNLYNCAAVICGGTVRGIVPKTFVPNYGEFYEKRWFTSAENVKDDFIDLSLFGLEGIASFDTTQVFQIAGDTLIGVEICEDMWTPLPPSSALAMRGAEVIVNLSASNEVLGKRDLRRDMLRRQSAACNCVYAYCSSGSTESAQDMVFSGHSMIVESGVILRENTKQIDSDYMIVQDCDLGIIRHERRRNKSFADAGRVYDRITNARIIGCDGGKLRSDGTLYPLRKNPFMPACKEKQTLYCKEAFSIQVAGLKQRLALLGAKPVVGISGGLDSTLALLVAVEAVRQLGRPVSDVHGITMPCFGTSDRTYQNAWELMKKLGITAKEIKIGQAVKRHFADIGHDESVHNGTYENAQARERTQVLMDYAGMVGGIVVGTGDLSELALGWCTYNGDHMSMYAVNASVPKTMIPGIIDAVAADGFADVKDVLRDIVDTPISPELLPPDESGKIAQVTEDLVGPYALHDFFLYHMFCHGFTPAKIYTLACRAFADEYDAETVKKWLKVFYRRFFTQQFKRNCVPDGVKVGKVGLSPRGDWRMPSDASANLWLNEVDKL